MGITRNNRHKRRATGGKKKHYRKARKFELGHQPTNTKIGERKISLVRMRGGNMKQRAIRLDAGNFSWATEGLGRKTRILGVTYNATSNEFQRTNTLVKNCIVQVDATPFRLWYEQHYGIKLNKAKKVEPKKGAKKGAKGATPAAKKSVKSKKDKNAKKEDKAPKEKKEKKEVPKKPKITKEERKKNKKAKKEAAKKDAAKAATSKKGTATTAQKKKPSPASAIAAALIKRAKLSKRKRAELWRENFLRKLKLRKIFKSHEKYEKHKAEAKAAGKVWQKRPTPHQRTAKFLARKQQKNRDKRITKTIDSHLQEQFLTGRLYACISSRPGQDGAADGYILEGKELDFYVKKMKK